MRFHKYSNMFTPMTNGDLTFKEATYEGFCAAMDIL